MSDEDRNLLLRLPPECKFDQDEFWSNLVTMFKDSVEKQDILLITNILYQIEYYTSVMKQYLSTTSNPNESSIEKKKKYNGMILGPLFDLITKTPFIDFCLQARAAKLFADLTVKYQTRPTLSELHLPLQKILDLFNNIFAAPHRLMSKSLPAREIGFYVLFFSSVSYFFDEADGDILLDKYLDKIGCFESVSLISTLILLRFYPTTGPCFEKTFKHFITLIQNPASSGTSCAALRYFGGVYFDSFYHKYFDWKPYIRSIFNTISGLLNSSVKVLGDDFRPANGQGFNLPLGIISGYDEERIPLYASTFVSTLFVEYEEEKGQETTNSSVTLSILKDFVTAFIPMITPKSKRVESAVNFISGIIVKLVTYIHRLDAMKKHDAENVKNINISDQVLTQFVDIVLPFVQSALFNGKYNVQNEIIKCVPRLAELSYQATVDALVPFCLNNMVDAEMTTTSKICFNVIKILIPTMLNEKHLEENFTNIPQIIEASLERCKNTQLKNYFLGMSVLSEIAQFISIPAEKDMTAKLTIKQRMVATAMINSLETVIKCHFEHNKPLTTDQADNPYSNMLTGTSLKDGQESIPAKKRKNAKQPQKEDKEIDKRFDCYFSAFDDSYIENIVITSALKHLKNASNASFLNNFTYKFTKYLSKAKPDLIARSLSPKLEELFNKSNTTRKPFWAHLLASTFVSCPTLLEKIPHYVELINSLLVIKEESGEKKGSEEKKDDQDDEIECNLKCAQVLIYELLAKVPGPNIIEWSNCEEKDSGDKPRWGIIYQKYQVHPKWYEIDRNAINSAVDSIFKAIQPHLAKFPSYTLKKQKIITKILNSFFCLFNMRGRLGVIQFNDLHDNQTFASVEKSLFQFINEMLSTIQSYQGKEEILSLLSSALFNYNVMFNKSVHMCLGILNYRYNYIYSKECTGTNSSRFINLLSYQNELISSLYNYSCDITPNVELVLDNLYSLIQSEFTSISHRVISIFSKIPAYSKRLHEEFILKQMEVLEDPNKTEYQCKGAILYIAKPNIIFIMKNQEWIVRLFKAIITLKYEKDWKITEHINTIITAIEFYRSIAHIEETKVWRDFLNEILTLPRTIDPRQFYFLLRFIFFQDPIPSIDLVRFVINSLKSESDANRHIAMSCLSNLLCRMKPIAPRSKFASVEDFKGSDGLLPYIDKITTGYHCKPSYYTFYTGPSVFDEKSKKFEEIRKFLVDEVFNNEKIFSELFESFVLLHPTEDNPHFIKNVFDIWKGIGQIIRTSIVKYTKSLIFSVLDVNDISKTTPVRLATLCELVAGISRATKHWTSEEKKLAIDEILVPFCTPMVRFKGCDMSTVSVIGMTSSMIGDWDYRRIQWMFDIVERTFKECLSNKGSMNEIVLRSVMSIARSLYIETNQIFNQEFVRIMKNIVIPLFSDLKSFKLDYLASLASLLVSRHLLTGQYHPGAVHETYYSVPSFQMSTEMTKLVFDLFDSHKDESPELVALILSEIFTQDMIDFSFFIPFITERFTDLCTIDSKLVNITSGKFLHYGKNIFCKLGFLSWTNLGDKMEETLFNNIIKKQLMSVRESLPWNSRLNLVGFLHVLTFGNFFTFTKKEFSVLIDEVLPSFLEDSNQEVRAAALALLRMLVCVVYNNCWEVCAEKVAKYFELASKEKGKINKKLYVAVSFASALVDNTYVWFQGCPEWLPAIFDALERTYSRGDCKEEIKNSVGDFFRRHQGREIPEVEDYKYSFTGGYFT